jgi:hypothetical protein
MEPYFGQGITSMFAAVSTSQNFNTVNSLNQARPRREVPFGTSRGARAVRTANGC